MLDAFDDGNRHIVNTLRISGVTEKGSRKSLRRWGDMEQERGHLENHVRGAPKGVKFVLDSDELDVVKRDAEAFPDIYADEMVTWFGAQDLR